jgi:hypothetical protein
VVVVVVVAVVVVVVIGTVVAIAVVTAEVVGGGELDEVQAATMRSTLRPAMAERDIGRWYGTESIDLGHRNPPAVNLAKAF